MGLRVGSGRVVTYSSQRREGSGVSSEETAEARRFNVLIVDDEAATRTLLKTVVQGLSVPCQVFEAVDGEGALEIARRSRPDLVLLDIVLPGSGASGVLVCQELCKDRRTRVVIISGKAGESVINACMYAGAMEHVPKPFSVPDLRAKLEQWLSS
jgi:CheY-like chemotaxis protein